MLFVMLYIISECEFVTSLWKVTALLSYSKNGTGIYFPPQQKANSIIRAPPFHFSLAAALSVAKLIHTSSQMRLLKRKTPTEPT